LGTPVATTRRPRRVAFATDTPWLADAAYRGNDGHVYEIMW
jgi:hypothetical protein